MQADGSDKLLETNIQEYLNSKITAGGLYGLTISDEDFVKGLVKVVKMAGDGKKFKHKEKEMSYDSIFGMPKVKMKKSKR